MSTVEGPRLRLLVEGDAERLRLALLDGDRLAEIHTEGRQPSRVGEVHLGRVRRLAPAIDAAFVDIGLARNAFLHEDDFGLGDGEESLAVHQLVIVQILRDELPGKGARVRRGATLPGRHLVLLASGEGVALSSRIEDEQERERLRSAVESVASSSVGWIVRTAAVGIDSVALASEAATLTQRWAAIEGKAASATSPRLLHRDLDSVERWLRDRASEALEEIWVDSSHSEDAVLKVLARLAPGLAERVRVHDGSTPLFERFGVERQLEALWNRRVALPSGGSLVIEQTEALVAIDVNSGRDLGAANLEETAVATNLEAAVEVGRQLRLRDLAGIIVVDFIDMESEESWGEVRRALDEELARDRASSMVEGPVAFGLMAITRKRQRLDVVRRLSVECAVCQGTGRHRSPREVLQAARRALLAAESAEPGRGWRLRLHPTVRAELDHEAEAIGRELEARLGERLDVQSDAAVSPALFELDEASGREVSR
jgi:ribonuclease G